MKKCSKTAHHTLTELNITPLLDLAFVLLVIFIITTTPLVNDLELNLPLASKNAKDPKPKINYVTVDSAGKIFLNKLEVDFDALRDQMIALRSEDPDLNVIIRGDAKTKYQKVVNVLDMLQQANIAKVALATDAPGTKPK